MTATYAIDFETYYDKEVSITTAGAYAYLRDPACEIYMVSIVGPDYEYVGSPKAADWARIADARWVAHNYSFDGMVVEKLREDGVIPDAVRPSDWNCTANLSVYNHAPRNLGGAAKQLLGLDLDKGMRSWMKGRTWQEAVAGGKAEALMEYALLDSRACIAIWDKYAGEWPEMEQWYSRHTISMGWRGVPTDMAMLETSIAKLQQAKWYAQTNMPFYTSGAKGLSFPAFHKCCRDAGILPPASTAKDDPECAIWEAKHSDIPWVRHMRDWRRANVALARLLKMRDRTRADGTCPFNFKYYGGHTGRWAGDTGLNLQNQNRDVLVYDGDSGFTE
ncbi:MAG: hypothetical protein ABI162_06935 [Luteolibacter sp.]